MRRIRNTRDVTADGPLCIEDVPGWNAATDLANTRIPMPKKDNEVGRNIRISPLHPSVHKCNQRSNRPLVFFSLDWRRWRSEKNKILSLLFFRLDNYAIYWPKK